VLVRVYVCVCEYVYVCMCVCVCVCVSTEVSIYKGANMSVKARTRQDQFSADAGLTQPLL
jgi:hypothetical protein